MEDLRGHEIVGAETASGECGESNLSLPVVAWHDSVHELVKPRHCIGTFASYIEFMQFIRIL
jgi:hypothetical protein